MAARLWQEMTLLKPYTSMLVMREYMNVKRKAYASMNGKMRLKKAASSASSVTLYKSHFAGVIGHDSDRLLMLDLAGSSQAETPHNIEIVDH